MPNYDEIIKQSQENIRKLNIKLVEFDNLYKYIVDLTSQPEAYDNKFKDIIKLTEKYTNTIGASTKKYIDITDTLLSNKITELDRKIYALQKEASRLEDVDITESFSELQSAFIIESKKNLKTELSKFERSTESLLKKNDDLHSKLITELKLKTDELQKEISRLTETDITNLFNELKESFIEQTRKDLSIELKRIDQKTKELQVVIDTLKKEATRFEKIDLEKYFDKHQKTLSEIFGAVNSINSVLSSITQTLTGITQGIGVIQNSIDEKHKVLKNQIDLFNRQISSHLKNQDIEIEKNNKSYNSEFEILKNQNKKLKNETKTIRLIQIIEIIAVLSILIYTIIR